MVENGGHVQQTNDGQKYLDVGGYIIPFTIKEDIMTIKIRKSTWQELSTITYLNLTSELLWNLEEINQEEISSKYSETLVSHIQDKDQDERWLNLKNKIRQYQYNTNRDWYMLNRIYIPSQGAYARHTSPQYKGWKNQ